MKLNRGCMNDIMLFLEENLDYPNEGMAYREISEKVSTEDHCSANVIFYSLKKLGELGCLEIRPHEDIRQCTVLDITMEGHEYIKNVKDKKNFNI